MPQPIVLNYDGLARGIETAGSALGTALGERAAESRKQEKYGKDATTLQNLLNKVQPKTIQEAAQLKLKAYEAGISPEIINSTFDMYKPIWEQNIHSEATDRLIQQYGLNKNQQNNQDFRQQNTQLDQYQPEGLLAQQQQRPQQRQQINKQQDFLSQNPYVQERPQENQEKLSPITTIKQAQAFAKAPVNKQQDFLQRSTNNGTTDLSDRDLEIMSLSKDPSMKNLVDTKIKLRGMQEDRYAKDRKYHQQGSAEAEKSASAMRNSLRQKEASIRLTDEAIATGETGPLSLANISQRLGLPELMNPAGTQLNQAGKEFFFGTLSRLAAKNQNIWMDQKINSLMAQVGDPQLNAQMKTTILGAELKANKAYLKEYDRLANEDMQNYGYVRKDIESRAYAASEDEHNKIMDETSYKTRKIYEQDKGEKWLVENINKKVPKGTIATPSTIRRAIKKADGVYQTGITNLKKLGYTIAKTEDIEQWQQ